MKREYMKPQMRVVELHHQPQLLCGSGRGLQSAYGPLNYRGSDEDYDEEEGR